MKLVRDNDDVIAIIAISVIGLLLFAASFNDPFHFDDVLIRNDANVTNPSHFFHFFNPLHLRQLTFLTFYLNHLIGGDNPGGYHVVNVLLHVANAVLLFILLREFFDRWLAVAAAGLFLVHPIQTEPVLYIYQRSILLGCLFSLLALIAITRQRPWLAGFFFLCAFESKESTLAVPLAVALLYLSSNRRYRIVLLCGVLLFTIAGIGLLAYQHEQTVGIGIAGQVRPLSYFMTETRVVYTYIRLLFFPYTQSLEYEFSGNASFLPLLGICAILGFAWVVWKNERWRIPAGCVFAFFILLAPTSSFIPSADAAFEHRLYLPMLAFSVLMAWLLSRLPLRSLAITIVFAALIVLTVRRETVWSSDTALWEDTVSHVPGKARAWFNLGGAYLNTNPEKARPALLKALELKPDFVEAWYDLGILEQQRGRPDAAISYYQRALELDPHYWQAWNNSGITLMNTGNREAALHDFEETLHLNPDYWPAQYNIGIIHFMAGRYSEAIPRLKIVLDWQPDFRDARYALATCYTRIGDKNAAAEELRELGLGPSLSK
ncbi:MAG TPA: tetratricopeptide repeat protein [Terriglobia bacterium]|nr:tetratricopeptide repeat protein [Terriglobia bacterium]